MKPLLPFLVLLLALLLALSCATRRPTFFEVLPAEPSYLLRSPDLEDIPFPEVRNRGGAVSRPGEWRTHAGFRRVKGCSAPKDQPPVSKLIPAALARCRYHRFVYQVIFRSKGETRGAVLLGAGSASEIQQLGAQLLTDPDAVCGGQSVHCAACSRAWRPHRDTSSYCVSMQGILRRSR